METALRQCIDEIQIMFNDAHYAMYKQAYKECIGIIQANLEKEKQQIKNAYEQGHSDGDIEDYPLYKDSEHYFNQTFLSNENT